MKREPLQPIPIPFAQTVRPPRSRLLPLAVFAIVFSIVAALWKNNVAAPTFVGQAEALLAEVSSQKPGVVAGLNVTRLQPVRAGQVIGHVLIADPKLIEASLAVIRS